ncbi:hypothetical protein BKA70DRAFT_885015 [Coprinopsis sp. MPI-PUGE-AT-0042]|nr:hypothetical protein BKA70DRAFT_885015 [Coprinopsis sp. MPI-PUGE-AT-0042]
MRCCIDDKVHEIHLKRWNHNAILPIYLECLGTLDTSVRFLAPSTKRPAPWHRDISSSGTIPSRCTRTESARPQKDERGVEGVEVTTGRTGPVLLPSPHPTGGSVDTFRLQAGAMLAVWIHVLVRWFATEAASSPDTNTPLRNTFRSTSPPHEMSTSRIRREVLLNQLLCMYRWTMLKKYPFQRLTTAPRGSRRTLFPATPFSQMNRSCCRCVARLSVNSV